MSDYHRDNFGRLFDRITGLCVGYIDDLGLEQLFGPALTAAQSSALAAAVANGGILTPPVTGTLAQRELRTDLLAVPRSRFVTTDTFIVNGVANGLGTEWISDGAQWRPRMPQTILLDTSSVTGALQSAEQVLKSYTLPAGLLHLQRFQIDVAVGKTGLTDVLQQFMLRAGLTGTTADPQLSVTATALLSAAVKSAGYSVQFDATDAVTLVRRGTGGNLNLGSFDGNTSPTAMSAPTTVPNLQTNALRLSMTTSMVTAVADRPQVGDIRITILP